MTYSLAGKSLWQCPDCHLWLTCALSEHKCDQKNIQDIQDDDAESVTVVKYSGKWLQKTIHKDGTMTIQTVNVPTLHPVPTTPEIASKIESDGAGGWRRRRPRAKALFNIPEMRRDYWAWVVESRKKMYANPDYLIWGDFYAILEKPSGFGDRASALRRMISVMENDGYNIGLGIVEYRVMPHYLAYTPSDEPWYAKVWPPPSDSQSNSTQ